MTGAQEYGVFVSFCNGVRGLAPTQQLGLEPNQDPAKHFPIGKVGLHITHSLLIRDGIKVLRRIS